MAKTKDAKPAKGKAKAAPEPKGKAGKGAKGAKGGKPGKSKGSGEFGTPSEAPAGGDAWQLETKENIGKLFLITPLRSEHKPDTFSKEPGAVKEVIICDVVELNERKPEKSEEHTDVWAWGGYVRGALRGFIGDRRVLGRLGQGEKDRGNIPWILEDGDDDDVAVAKAYLASVDPFKTGKGGKTKGGK